ncbi:winged helix-turn-helix domain-containing protein [Stella sp.]|uniref:winged helix-turn-helix domain-containing protein n=1 Tax=Stella sp. TaxID=2912054 RepID=UPI0035B0D76C
MAKERFSAAEARRIALAAQGFAEARPAGAVDARHVRRVLERVGVFQIDSVNVLVRSHYLPLHARLGGYATALLDRLAYDRRRTLFEYWGHEASLMPLALQPLMRWRMERAWRGQGLYGGLARFGQERADYVRRVLAEVADRGPLTAGELSDGSRGEGGWWGWSDGKQALEFLFWAGRVTTASRRHFERVYDLPERVLPRDVLAAETPPEAEAQRRLLRLSARALGIATERDLRDYFRLPVVDTRERLAELVEAGELRPVAVEGWERPAFLDPSARLPRRIAAAALLSPFDSLIWERDRTLRLFGFHYRLAFYTPAERRTHGYYVLPFLMGDRLVGRVDLKADRAGRRLLVLAAHAEPGADPAAIAPALHGELAGLARWLGLDDVAVAPQGDLAPALLRIG